LEGGLGHHPVSIHAGDGTERSSMACVALRTYRESGIRNARRNRRSLATPIDVNNDLITRCSWLLRAVRTLSASRGRPRYARSSGRIGGLATRAAAQAGAIAGVGSVTG